MEYSSINLTQIVTTLITTIGAIFCAFVGKKNESKSVTIKAKEQSPKSFINIWAFGMWFCIVIALLNTAILGFRLFSSSPSTEITITYPSNLSRVEQTETVRGSVQGLLRGQKIWSIVFVQEVARYYPQNQPANLEASNKWSSLVYIGVPNDTDKKFDILAVVVDVNAQDAFNTYLSEAKDKSDWIGMESLPEGAMIYDRITVTRK